MDFTQSFKEFEINFNEALDKCFDKRRKDFNDLMRKATDEIISEIRETTKCLRESNIVTSEKQDL